MVGSFVYSSLANLQADRVMSVIQNAVRKIEAEMSITEIETVRERERERDEPERGLTYQKMKCLR